MVELDHIFKAYDVRGTVPDQLNPRLAQAVGTAFAVFCAEEAAGSTTPVTRVIVGRDMRPSGVELAAAFAEGVMAEGLDVVDIGLASTDMCYFAAGSLEAPAAMFTASHNPAGYNGIKFALSGARPVGESTGLDRVKSVAEATLAGVRRAPEVSVGTLEHRDVLDDFVAHVHSFVDVSRLAPLKVRRRHGERYGRTRGPSGLRWARDGPRGHVRRTRRHLPEPSGRSDPIREHRRPARRVVSEGADIGLAFDGDADRVFLVDETGSGLSGSVTTAIIAAGILDAHPGETVIHNLICSRSVPEVVREHGGVPLRTRVGHSFIKEVMADTGAIFGGEHSAHYYFRDNYRADSGLIAALVVFEQMSLTGKRLSELRAPFERYAASGESNTRVDDPARRDRGGGSPLRAIWASGIDRLDGLTVDGGDWWFNLRASNTEPLLRLNLEAPDDDQCEARVAEVRSVMAG